MGHKQLSGALLLDLAIRNSRRLVTFDKSVRGLLPANSAHQAAIETIPVP